MKDEIGTSDMKQGSLTYFTTDRFGNPNSSLALNGGWTYLPGGNYFNTPELTISVWILPQNVGSWSRLIDFGNGMMDNIILALASGNYPLPFAFEIFNASHFLFMVISSQNLTLCQWQFLTITYDGSNAFTYLNGKLTASHSYSYNMPVITRKNCYIGKSYKAPFDGYSSSYLDDLKFYNKSLTQAEILLLYNQYQTITSISKHFFNQIVISAIDF